MKTILFLNHDFFVYDRAIAEELRRRGYQVLSYKFVRQAGFFDRRFCKKQGITSRQYAANSRQAAVLSELEKTGTSVDVVLVTSGQAMNVNTLEKLHQMYPGAKFIWNLWDCIKEIENFGILKEYYDIIISFDQKEAAQHGFEYRPNFYIREIDEAQKYYDYCFVATYTEEREQILRAMLEQCPGKNNFVYLKDTPNNRILPAVKRVFSGEVRKLAKKKIYYKALDYDDMLEVFAKSRCVIDIARPGQTGLSMRPFEAMAVKSKLVTTNPEIRNYDFYRESNIAVVDADQIKMPEDGFLNSPYEKIPDRIYREYSIQNWCDHIQRLTE